MEALPDSHPATDKLVAEWCARDQARAFLSIDHDVIDSTMSVRAAIAEHVLAGGEPSRDLFHACGMLGRLIASRGGSPSHAASTIDALCEVLGTREAIWVIPARAALAEGFAAARRESARAEALARWEYPSCAVWLHEGIIAVAAGYPHDDEDALAAWAARVASAAALSGARRAVLGGSPAARAALTEALALAGIEILPSYEPTLRQAGKGRP
jgi:hypothetical protein